MTTQPMPSDTHPDEPEDDLEPEPEKRRFLLPEGCKDLIDVLRLEMRQQLVAGSSSSSSASSPAGDLPESWPKMVTLPDPVPVRDLAKALYLKPFQIIRALMEFNVFATISGTVEFRVAQAVCARCGILAKRA